MYQLHPQLAQDTIAVTSLPLCDVLLMDDARYPWLILVPRLSGISELHRLEPQDQQALLAESGRCADALERLYCPDKLNVGALGNVVPQLHWHIVARFHDDPAWPGPVWGHSPAHPYTAEERELRLAQLCELLGK